MVASGVSGLRSVVRDGVSGYLIDAHDPAEFCAFKWVETGELVDLIVPFKKRVYRAVIDEFRALI